MEKNMLKPNSLISKLPLWLLRGTAISMLSIAIFLGIAGYKIVPNEACAQCIALNQTSGLVIGGGQCGVGAGSGQPANMWGGATCIPPNQNITCPAASTARRTARGSGGYANTNWWICIRN